MTLDRRNLFKGATASATLASFAPALAGSRIDPAQSAVNNADMLTFGIGSPLVETTGGPVRGYTRRGVHTFKGVPYGASTGGAHRFLPPALPAKWTEPLDAIGYGYACQQIHGDDWARPLTQFIMNFNEGKMSEACLNLNVWTPGVADKRRPVLVWIHGGAFTNGSSFEMLPYDGENLARRGDLVFVSINHRLNALGFLDLSSTGREDLADSGNAGILDLIAALKWVRDNVSAFGGDPQNVTICGHSGGGGKVNALLRMPLAQGLFHKAIVQSGSIRTFRAPQDSARAGEAIIKQLGIPSSEIGRVQNLPYSELMAAAARSIAQLSRHDQRPQGLFGRYGWAPVADGKTLLVDSAEEINSSVPLMIGYTRAELASYAYDSTINFSSFDQVAKRVGEILPGDRSTSLLSNVRERYPDATPDFAYSVAASRILAIPALDQMLQRSGKTGLAPVFGYRFDWNPAICDGRLGAFHGLEIAFAFDNVERWDSATGGGARAQALADKMSQSWINFVRSGDPNGNGLPRWEPHAESRKVMIFDDWCRTESDQDRHMFGLPTLD